MRDRSDPYRVLVVEDDATMLAVISDVLGGAGYRVDRASTAETGVDAASAERHDAVLIDLMLGDESGLDVMARIKTIDPHAEAIITTGHASVETAVLAMSRGAFSYLAKPINMPELLLLVERAAKKARDAHEKELLLESLRHQQGARSADGMVAESAGMRAAIAEAADVAELDKPVFIHGESGAGKELIAYFIHRSSPRRERPINAVNCGSLTENLVDAELFGHEKGAFTGADRARPGIIAASEGGTLFLDEIGDLPEAAQVRLLRFLETGVVRPVGSNRERRFDVRIVTASHKDLAEEIKKGRFRHDLYHRLVVFEVRLPPLRERPDDVGPLARLFLMQIDRQRRFAISPASISVLQQQPWPGNVRELRNEVERAFLRARRRAVDVIEPQDFHLIREAPAEPLQFSGYGPIPLEQVDLLHVRHVVALCDGNRRRAAETLRVSERHLYRLLREAADPPPVE
jgi:two-component system, NtrC family, response regulator AtoC